MDFNQDILPATVLHWNYKGFTEFPIKNLVGDETDITDIYLKENLISRLPADIGRFANLESLYLSGNDITELPSEISKLRCLKCLDVSGNRLRRIPDEIGEVKSLKFLILDENELTELPLRIGELRALRLLSVCDNKLKWLPQRPVFNYYHCEIRFWRNTGLITLPYSLWLYMFKDQPIRSLNIGCLNFQKQLHVQNPKCRLKLNKDSRQWEIDVNVPSQYNNVQESTNCSPPSLYEISKRIFYQLICNVAKSLTEKTQSFSLINNEYYYDDNSNNGNIAEEFEGFNINNTNNDLNGNNLHTSPVTTIKASHRRNKKDHYTPSDVIEEFFNILPKLIKKDLCIGPVSRCEYVYCKRPVFDYAIFEFCFGKIILIDGTADVILSSTFCSKSCADLWKHGKTNQIQWTLINENY